MRRLTLALALAALSAPVWAVPEAAQESLDKARAALSRGDGIAAEAELQRTLGAGATRADIAADMGEAYIQQGERKKAREWLGPAQFAKGGEARGWRLLGLLERLDGNLPAAGRALDRAIAAGPKDPLVWVEVGRLRYQGGEQLQAIEAAEEALKHGPEEPRALEFMAQLVRDSAGDAAALPFYERALEVTPDDLSLLGGYAAALGEMGRGREMLAVTRKMIGIDPGAPLPFYLQAVLAARAGKTELARAMLNRCGNRLDGMPAAKLLLGALELEAGNANLAVQHLSRLADQQGANPWVQLLLARALYEAGDTKQLFARYGAQAGRGDASPYLLTVLARAYEDMGDRAAAAPLLERAAAALPAAVMAIPDGSGASVRGLLAAGNVAGAVRVGSAAVDQRPGSSEALAQLGDAELLAGQPGRAFDRYSLAARVRFTDQLALRSAIALEQGGRANQVPALAAGYLGIYPSSRLMARLAANLAIGAGDWAQARLILENLRLRGGSRDARLMADLGLAQLRTGDAEAALNSAARARAIAPASSFAVLVHALALAEREETRDQARQLVAQAAKIDPKHPLLAEARRKLR
ncbi:MAG TPA: tetratricopeptide repeat protein [Novosphingobium sp.]|nr:tetratricopeptide repeat protein [Novosphingobium sp.]